jgi:hypothetical protein
LARPVGRTEISLEVVALVAIAINLALSVYGAGDVLTVAGGTVLLSTPVIVVAAVVSWASRVPTVRRPWLLTACAIAPVLLFSAFVMRDLRTSSHAVSEILFLVPAFWSPALSGLGFLIGVSVDRVWRSQ